MSEKLKPCPFCGRVPKSDSNAYGGIVVWCNNKVCAAGIPIPVATWNRRSSPSFKADAAAVGTAAAPISPAVLRLVEAVRRLFDSDGVPNEDNVSHNYWVAAVEEEVRLKKEAEDALAAVERELEARKGAK